MRSKIKKVKLFNTFFENGKIIFSDNLNCIMGSRGTGKTTILEFLRFALNQPIIMDKSKQIQIDSLLDCNLLEGYIEVEIQTKDGLNYKIVRTRDGEPKIYNSENELIETNVNKLISCDFFGQGEIESIAVNSQEQLSRIIDHFEFDSIKNINDNIEKETMKLKSNGYEILKISEIINNYKDQISELNEVKSKLNNYKAQISEKEKDDFEKIDIQRIISRDISFEKDLIQNIKTWYNNIYLQIKEVDKLIDEFRSVLSKSPDYKETNLDKIQEIEIIFEESVQIFSEAINEFKGKLKGFKNKLGVVFDEISKKHDEQIRNYENFMMKYKDFKSQMETLLKIQKKYDDLMKIKFGLNKIKKSLSTLIEERLSIKSEILTLVKDRYNIRYKVIKNISEKLGDEIKIDLIKGALKNEFKIRLTNILFASNLRYSDLVEKITEFYSPEDFANIVRNNEVESITKLLSINRERLKKMFEFLNEDGGARLFDIETIVSEDKPIIKLKIREEGTFEDKYKESDKLSTGQKCTTILPIVLLKGDNPLFIDQPEDNLDNKFVYSVIVELIKEISKNKQLIFITHNPNIPVLGNSDYNVFLTSVDGKGYFLNQGSVDDVKDQIIEYLEGGEEAFKQRDKIYNLK